jgi:DNA-directed RNA polymerase
VGLLLVKVIWNLSHLILDLLLLLSPGIILELIKYQFDQTKQLNATMPNLIHSLKASSIALLYNLLAKCGKANIYTVYDCFAVTADKVD